MISLVFLHFLILKNILTLCTATTVLQIKLQFLETQDLLH